jgi:hypothetical protein
MSLSLISLCCHCTALVQQPAQKVSRPLYIGRSTCRRDCLDSERPNPGSTRFLLTVSSEAMRAVGRPVQDAGRFDDGHAFLGNPSLEQVRLIPSVTPYCGLFHKFCM